MEAAAPATLSREHEALHEQLREASRESDVLRKAAQAALELANPHFVRDETWALAALGLLPLVSKGTVTADMAKVTWSTDKLKADLKMMLSEHRQIGAALEIVAETARREGRMEYVTLAERWDQHTTIEEDVLYPAAIVIGEYIKLRLSGVVDPSVRRRTG